MRWLMVLVVAGCDGAATPNPSSSDLEGVYSVVAFELDDSGCSSAAVATWDAPSFQVAVAGDGDPPLLAVFPCAAQSDCSDDLLDAVYAFDTFDDSTGTGVWQSASFADGTCLLTWYEERISRGGDGRVEVEQRRYEVVDLTGADQADCEAQQDAWQGDRACTGLERLIGE